MRPILLSQRGSSFLPRTESGPPIRERSAASDSVGQPSVTKPNKSAIARRNEWLY